MNCNGRLVGSNLRLQIPVLFYLARAIERREGESITAKKRSQTRALYAIALALGEKEFGNSSYPVLHTQLCLGCNYEDDGAIAEAARNYILVIRQHDPEQMINADYAELVRDAYCFLGLLQYNASQYAAALPNLEKYLQLLAKSGTDAPTNWLDLRIFAYIAIAHAKTGDFQAARVAFRDAIVRYTVAWGSHHSETREVKKLMINAGVPSWSGLSA